MKAAALPTADEIFATVAGCEPKESRTYATAFRSKDGVEPGRGWDLLEHVFNFLFRSSNADAPFHPIVEIADKRSMIPSDLTEPQVNALATVFAQVDDPEFRSRVGDVLWLQRRDAGAARVAVRSYIDSGCRLEDPRHWVASMERYERALRLARKIEPKGELPEVVLSHLQSRVFSHDGKDPLYFTLRALELLDESSFGEFERLAAIAGRIAADSRSKKNYDRARSHFAIQARLLKRAGQTDAAENARVSRAECLIEEAEDRENAGGHIVGRVYWEQAIQACRERPSLRGRVEELQKRLAAAGEKALGEMQEYSVEIDLCEPVNEARKALRGREREEAFFVFATAIPLIDPAKIREEALASMRDAPLRTMFDATVFDAAGRKVGTRPSAATDDAAEYEAAVAGFMEEHARFHRTFRTNGYIAPALQQLLSDHAIDEAVIESLIGDSLLIAEDRRPLFVQGLACGFRWDFCTALHLLVPQVENGLRLALESSGVLPRNVDATGVEEVWSYERILGHEATEQLLGAPMVYELESLLINRLGSNLRNLIAHGLLSRAALNGERALYLWWVLLRLASIPTTRFRSFVARQERPPAAKAEPDGEGTLE